MTQDSLPSPSEPLEELRRRVVECEACPRLVAWRGQVAGKGPVVFRTQSYWSRPLPGFGDPRARVMIVGLAPAAHGGNRTGRIFTGDRSASFLFRALFEVGLSNLPDSVSPDDGVQLTDCYLTAVVRCAPPRNKPTAEEIGRCLPYLVEELDILRPRVVVALGGLAWAGALRAMGSLGVEIPKPKPRFAHGNVVGLEWPNGGALFLLGSYHPSQQNTFTKRLTPAMLRSILLDAVRRAESDS